MNTRTVGALALMGVGEPTPSKRTSLLQAQHLQRPTPATPPLTNRMGMPGPGVVVRHPIQAPSPKD